MPNIIDATGLQTATREELVTNFTAAMQRIYGADINLASDTPDGQMMNIFIQTVLDLEDLLAQIYNTFDPDNAIGVILDQRVAINGIERQAGTFTVTPVTLVVSQAINLYGLDQTAQPIFTVSDNAGNLWELQTTQNIGSPGTYVYNFQAAVPGAVLTVPNTITIPVTIVLGVTSINNPTTYTTLGVNEESDALLKVRRQKSVSLASQGYLAGLLAALENINGVTAAFVYENNTSLTDVDGVPGHTIWVIVSGSGTAANIAQAIYTKRNAGAGMFGSINYTITQVDGSPFIVSWDDVVPQNLFIAFTATSIDGSTPPAVAAILAQLPTLFVPGVFQEVNINTLATYVQKIDSNCLVTNAGFSTGLSQTLFLTGIPASGTFKINYAGNLSASINWNDAIGVIQTKVQAISGLGGCLVTGSLASQTLVFNLSAAGSAQALLVAQNNSLLTGGAVAIDFIYTAGFASTLIPTRKTNQFVISSDNIKIIPMVFSPPSATVAHTASLQFNAYGGYGSPVYSFLTNNSGGSINSTTGLYTAGSTPSTDTIEAIDEMGNSVTAAVTVT